MRWCTDQISTVPAYIAAIENSQIAFNLQKHNGARLHHIGEMKFEVTNWAEYDAGLANVAV
jgi:hypothetical protein